jgi:hypothetical protein
MPSFLVIPTCGLSIPPQARSETLMWRHYYERRYLSLVADLYVNSRTQYGFSPWESVKIAAAAARAAQAFQPSTSRTGAQWRCRFLRTILV